MALLAPRGSSTPSLSAQGGQRRLLFLNISRDIATQLGDGSALTEADVVGPAIAAEDLFRYSSLNPEMGATIRRLAGTAPQRLALMHGPSFVGDGAAALHALADDYDRRVGAALS